MEAEERAARRAVRDRKLAILEQLYWYTDFRREALARANAELGTPPTCAPAELLCGVLKRWANARPPNWLLFVVLLSDFGSESELPDDNQCGTALAARRGHEAPLLPAAQSHHRLKVMVRRDLNIPFHHLDPET